MSVERINKIVCDEPGCDFGELQEELSPGWVQSKYPSYGPAGRRQMHLCPEHAKGPRPGWWPGDWDGKYWWKQGRS